MRMESGENLSKEELENKKEGVGLKKSELQGDIQR